MCAKSAGLDFFLFFIPVRRFGDAKIREKDVCFFGCCSLPGFFKQKKRLAGTSTLLYCGSQIYVNLLLNAAVSVASQQHS